MKEVEREEARAELEEIEAWARRHLRGTVGNEQRQVRAIRQAIRRLLEDCKRLAVLTGSLIRFYVRSGSISTVICGGLRGVAGAGGIRECEPAWLGASRTSRLMG